MTKHELYYSEHPIPEAGDAAPLRGAGTSPLPTSIVLDIEGGLIESAQLQSTIHQTARGVFVSQPL
jgi:hypothetical protein